MSEHLKSVVEKVRALAEPVISREGMELVDVEYVREGGRWVVRMYIDKPGGVMLDDCQAVSRQIDTMLDVEDFIGGTYSLEVSSPGIERPLRTVEHFERFVGRQVEIKAFAPLGEPPRKNFKGKLLGISEDKIVSVEIDGRNYQVPFEKIAKASLAFDFKAFEEMQGRS